MPLTRSTLAFCSITKMTRLSSYPTTRTGDSICVLIEYHNQLAKHCIIFMIENKDKSGEANKGEQLKRFAFFNVENIPEKVVDVASHPVTFSQLKIRNIKAIYPKYDVSDEGFTYWRTRTPTTPYTCTPTRSSASGSRTPTVPSWWRRAAGWREQSSWPMARTPNSRWRPPTSSCGKWLRLPTIPS